MPQGTRTPPPQASTQSPLSKGWILLLLLLAAIWAWRLAAGPEENVPAISYTSFYDLAQKGDVDSVTLTGPNVSGKLKAPETVDGKSIQDFRTTVPSTPPDEQLVPLLRDKGVKIVVRSEDQPVAVQLALALLPWVLIIGASIWISRKMQKAMSPGSGFGGREPERFRRLGGKIPRGVLLVGPPGTGKTLLARAVAGEAGVPFFSISGSEFIELFVGVGASRVRDLFDEAKKSAPAIIFIDEIDAVGRVRGTGLGGGNDEREQTLNQLLSEMDGFTRNDLIVVIAATNRPDVLDPALLRPGRFDRRVLVERPEAQARLAILHVHTRGKPLGPDVSLQELAQATPGFSGAELENLVNEAALNATRRGAERIEGRDFSAAYDKILLGDPRETRLSPDEKHRVAIHESGHAVVAHFTPGAEPLRRVSILPRGMSLGATQQTLAEDRHIATQPEIEAKLRVLMGGYAAESFYFKNVSSGSEQDLKQATDLAFKMVAQYGMSEKIGPLYLEHHGEHPFLGQRLATEGAVSDETVHTIEDEARKLLRRAVEDATAAIMKHKAALDALVDALLRDETLERPAVVQILGEPVAA
jgi:cell division protease FtsH